MDHSYSKYLYFFIYIFRVLPCSKNDGFIEFIESEDL
jgi:hypothetical protein